MCNQMTDFDQRLIEAREVITRWFSEIAIC
jgi:hypothetical protein